ncbi:amidase [Teratosphaeria nubilosa]|uniref:Amidase n=1 Tax=Teratosphaeria nubilosa TaxID=161662 RepID=A0A6G1KU82_9PEZI|nr:amidase [Teratosphaeria nubilosa]
MTSVQENEPWQAIASGKQAERTRKTPLEWRIPDNLLPPEDKSDVQDFPQTSGLFTARELAITSSTASEVVSKIAAREWQSEEVVKAVCHRAAVAQQLLNCITEIYFDEAIARAKDLDAYQSRTGETTGPLHGLPISLKDQFNLPGLDSTIGYISYAFKPATEPSTLVTLLLNAGAIMYVKTNVPATLMMGESVNNVFGRTVNPRNRQLTTGGSSGGESALLTFRGSLLGVGTDIGGSIRHPCSFTGLFGLRPSHGRVSYQGVTNTYLGQEAVRSCAGPMCHSANDVRLFMTSLASRQPWLHDPQCLPLPWREDQETLPRQLCFGIATSDGHCSATPPLLRALALTKSALEAAGHKTIPFTPVEMQEAHDLIMKMWSADGGEEFLRDTTSSSGEPLNPQIQRWVEDSQKQKPSVLETWRVQHQRALLAQKWLERWQATERETGTGRPLDGLIMPSTPFPAIRHDGGYPHYGVLSPLLDLTTGVFPVTKVDVQKDRVPKDWKPVSEKDKEVMEYYGRPENHENALVGLALVGRRLEEEKVTAMLSLISEVVGVDY